MLPEIMGYRRPDGRFGIRNHIAVIATMDNANPTVRRICSLVKGCVPFCPGFGRGEMNEDLALHNLLSINTALHPNVYGVIVVALEDQTAEYISGEIAKGGKPVVGFSIEDQGGTVEVAYRAAQAAIQMLHDAGRLRPEPMPWSEFVLGVECGGSDGFSGLTGNPLLGAFSDFLVSRGGSTVMTEVAEMFGAETILMNRAVNRTVYEKVVALINDYKQYCFDNHASISGNPSLGNLDGGISTLEDKALGCTQKGGTAPVVDVLEYAHPLLRPGFQLLCAPGSDTAGTTALGLCCQMVIFTTGRGTPYGGFIPTVKVATNSEMYRRKKNWNDFDAGRLVDGVPMASMLEEFVALIRDVASGRRLTKAEKNGFKEFVIWKNGISE